MFQLPTSTLFQTLPGIPGQSFCYALPSSALLTAIHVVLPYVLFRSVDDDNCLTQFFSASDKSEVLGPLWIPTFAIQNPAQKHQFNNHVLTIDSQIVCAPND